MKDKIVAEYFKLSKPSKGYVVSAHSKNVPARRCASTYTKTLTEARRIVKDYRWNIKHNKYRGKC